jgi:hypothetical protein
MSSSPNLRLVWSSCDLRRGILHSQLEEMSLKDPELAENQIMIRHKLCNEHPTGSESM